MPHAERPGGAGVDMFGDPHFGVGGLASPNRFGPRSIFDRPPAHPFDSRDDFNSFEMHHWMDSPHYRRDHDVFGRRTNLKQDVKTLKDVEILNLTVDQCVFKLVNNDGLFIIRTNLTIPDLIKKHIGGENPLLTPLLSLLTQLSEQDPSDKLKPKFNLLPLLNSLCEQTDSGIKLLTESLIKLYQSNYKSFFTG